jgi:hypothetical protein
MVTTVIWNLPARASGAGRITRTPHLSQVTLNAAWTVMEKTLLSRTGLNIRRRYNAAAHPT